MWLTNPRSWGKTNIATATGSIKKKHFAEGREYVMVDLGIPPWLTFAERRHADYHRKSAGQKSGRLEKFT